MHETTYPPMHPFQVVIIEDEADFREWLQDEVNALPGFACIAAFSGQHEAIRQVPKLNPDVVLVDLGLGNSNLGGVICMVEIKMKLPEVRFMVITGHSDDERVFEALKAGAGAYLLKNDIPSLLPKVLPAFMDGGAPMSPEIAQKVIRSFHQPPTDARELQSLTPREMEVLEHIAQGFLNKEISRKLSIAENTVKVISHNIYRKLQVNNRVEAVRKYFNNK